MPESRRTSVWALTPTHLYEVRRLWLLLNPAPVGHWRHLRGLKALYIRSFIRYICPRFKRILTQVADASVDRAANVWRILLHVSCEQHCGSGRRRL